MTELRNNISLTRWLETLLKWAIDLWHSAKAHGSKFFHNFFISEIRIVYYDEILEFLLKHWPNNGLVALNRFNSFCSTIFQKMHIFHLTYPGWRLLNLYLTSPTDAQYWQREDSKKYIKWWCYKLLTKRICLKDTILWKCNLRIMLWILGTKWN